MKKHFLLSDIDPKFINSISQSTKDYYIDSDGVVTIVHKKTGRKKVTKGSINNGYHGIWIYDRFGRRTIVYVHSIVAKVLCRKPSNYDDSYKVVHLDKDKTNNQLSNIMIVTPNEWREHYMDEFSKMKGRSRLDNIPHSKLTVEQVRSIKLLLKKGYKVKSIANLYDEVSVGQIYRIKRNENWSHI